MSRGRHHAHETRITRLIRIMAGRVWSGGFLNLAGRIGSGRVKICRTSRGSGRVRAIDVLKTSLLGLGQAGWVGSDPTRPARYVPTGEKAIVVSLVSLQTRRVTCLLCFFTSYQRYSCTGLIGNVSTIGIGLFESSYVAPNQFK